MTLGKKSAAGVLPHPGVDKVAKQSPRINVNLSAESYKTLKELAKNSDMDMSTFVRNALQVYNTLKQERLKGRKIYIGTNDKIEKELLLP